MALYLKKDMLKVVKSAQVTVNLTKLGKVSTNRIAKFLVSGNIQGNAVTAQIARGILDELKEPYIHQTTWQIHWFNLPEQALDELRAVGNALNLAMPSEQRYWRHSVESLMHPKPTGKIVTHTEAVKPFVNHMKTIKTPPSEAVIKIAQGIKSRSIKETTIQIYTGE